MDDFPFGFSSVFLIPISAIVGGITVAVVATIAKGRVRELEIRERIAMIERGVVPPPESDPGAFDRSMSSIEHVQNRHVGHRFRSAGVIVMSLGFGLMVLIGFSGAPLQGIGVGGFLVILGVGLLINGLLASRQPPPYFPPQPPPPGRASGSDSPSDQYRSQS